MSISDRVFDLPSVNEIIQQAVDDLMRGKNVIFILKDDLTPEIIAHHFYSAIGGRQLIMRPIAVGTQSPLDTIFNAEQTPMSGKPTAQKLAESGALPDVILITDLEKASESHQRQWLDWMRMWAELSQNRQARGQNTTAHLMILPPNPGLLMLLPPAMPSLCLYCWSDCLSSLEIRLLCHMHRSRVPDEIALRWREYTLPELASLDIGLADHLWNVLGHNQSTTSDLINALKQYAVQRRWDAKEAALLPDEKSFAQLKTLTRKEELWQMRGWLYRTPEHGWEWHSALLALRGDETRIAFRYWRGQSHLLLSLLDQIRRHIIDACDSRRPRGWHLGGKPSFWLSDAPFEIYDVEWWWLINQVPDTESRTLASKCRELRNRIAHYKPITLRDYRDLLDAYSTIRNR